MQLIKPMIVDAYDSDCDALNSANIALIANLSRNWLQMHSLSTQSGKPGPMNLINHINLQNSIRFEKPFYLKKVRESKPKLYDGNVILKMDTIVIPDSDETLMLCEESRSKMLLKEQDPMVHGVPPTKRLFEVAKLDPSLEFISPWGTSGDLGLPIVVRPLQSSASNGDHLL
ncbi:hypothetical protein Tco_1120831 [Tanacetum coccineum]|uniref:Uncharacterized protein n=1 Tax=Tanacetum coccineum TaxID=301880 RepID=A0ABQ5IX16_9ASTR